jgi:AmmeMemoRadiSam system protein B
MRGVLEVPSIRPPAVAGLFYPRDAQKLRAVLDDCSARAVRPKTTPSGVRPAHAAIPKALIAPHAGYLYSGPIAASAYGALDDAAHRIRRVVLIGPSHFVRFSGLAVSRATAFETPLGAVPVDDSMRREILRLPQVVAADSPHAREHSLEVQLPFLQVLLGEFRVLPIAAGYATVREVAAALDHVWGAEETLIIVSSDLSHYLSYDVARGVDAATAQAILARSTDLDGEQACGCAGINGLMQLASERALEVRLLDLRNSGDTTAERSRVVGYGAFALYDSRAMIASARLSHLDRSVDRGGTAQSALKPHEIAPLHFASDRRAAGPSVRVSV